MIESERGTADRGIRDRGINDDGTVASVRPVDVMPGAGSSVVRVTATTGSLPAAAFKRAIEWENWVPYMYLDSKGEVTIGVGHKMPHAADAAVLDLRRNSDKSAATEQEKRSEYATLTGKKKNQFYGHYKKYTKLYLEDDAIMALLTADLETAVKGLQRNLPDYASYPGTVQEALIDMVLNLGINGLLKKFPDFIVAVKKKNWTKAAVESHRKDVEEKRNADVRRLLGEAAKCE